jgi:hypothetical protein
MRQEQKSLMKRRRTRAPKPLAGWGNGKPNGRRFAKAARLPAYKNSALPIEKRVEDLLSRMTLEEKVAQMVCVWQHKAQTLLDGNGNFDLQKAKTAFKKRLGLGQVGRPSDAGSGKGPKENAELTNILHRTQPPGDPGDLS